jgi:uncharacterized protein (TIGR03643 family)
LSAIDIDRIIQMAWEDRTPFEAIKYQFNITEKEVIRLMKKEMTEKNWKKWRARVQGRKTKHLQLRDEGVNRFKSSRQKNISGNRISKR